MNDPRFPIGQLMFPGRFSAEQRKTAIAAIRELPAQLRAAVEGLYDSQLDTPYREGGWTVRQVAHHLGDSHLNAFVRTKLALTEDEPTIRAYDQDGWAELADSKMPLDVTLQLLDGVHQRWVVILESLEPAQFERRLQHPENGPMTFDDLLATYAWHGAHHVAHVTALRAVKGW